MIRTSETSLVEVLLERDEFRDLWVMKWAELLQIRTTNGVSPKGIQLYDRWLRERVRAGATIDKIVQELIPASGGTFENPATSYYQTETTPQLSGRERRPGVSGHADPMRPMPQSSVRSLDHGRLLRFRGLLQPGGIQAGARPAGDHGFQRRDRRDEASVGTIAS